MGSFDGLAEIYERSRHGYPPELRDRLVAIDALRPSTVVVDLGAGTGQLALMAATVSSSIVAVDPELDMIDVGTQATNHVDGIRWMLGADKDVCELLEPTVDLVLIGNAFHHMQQSALLDDLDTLINRDGAVVVCSTSVPVWLQDTDWSRALKAQLGRELGRPVGPGGTPDHASDVTILESSSFAAVEHWELQRACERSSESIIGEIVSSASGAIDDDATQRLFATLDPHLDNGVLSEVVKTTALIARRVSD